MPSERISPDRITNDKLTCSQEENYFKAMRYYFDTIMKPFKSFLLKGIAKIEDLEIETICLGHGPVLVKDPWKNVELYKQWALGQSQHQENRNNSLCVRLWVYG